jgi:2-phosphosulfolactate phosphatase
MACPITVRPLIDVAFTRCDLRPADVAVVVDVLRATSTAVQALASGYRSVLCVAGVEHALTLREPGRVLAGERHCVMPAGFQMGNSPLEAMHVQGEQLVLATTNGAPTIVAAARQVDTALVGCLLNLDAVIAALDGADDVQLVCSGTDGAAALEDMYVAGRICERLDGTRTDAARIAEAVARAYRSPVDALSASEDARALEAAGLCDDIAFCARESVLDIVPRVTRIEHGAAMLEPSIDRADTLIA